MKVNEVIGVAGFTVPGTRVDVLVTLGDEGMTRAVVSNVGAARFNQEQAKDGKPIPSSVVTLLLAPEDADVLRWPGERLAMLVLHMPLDVVPTETRGVRRGKPDGCARSRPSSRRLAVSRGS